ncbi:MAG: small basic protein [Planctomycetes bacterium]|nr:small basic protein [Planctomycetota bacterium]
MSIHSSLRMSGKMSGSRSVWTRAERIAVLKREGRWTEAESVLGLPKVRTVFKVKTKKQLKAEAAAAAQADADEKSKG